MSFNGVMVVISRYLTEFRRYDGQFRHCLQHKCSSIIYSSRQFMIYSDILKDHWNR